MFNKKQLVVMWIVVLIVSALVSISSVTQHYKTVRSGWAKWRRYYYTVNYFRLSIIPVLIGGMLMLTISKRTN